MNDVAARFYQAETDATMDEVSDEALEVAAHAVGHKGAAYTVAMCTGGIECPY